MTRWFTSLWRGKRAPAAKAVKPSPQDANARRAQLIKNAMAAHQEGDALRTAMRTALKGLEDPRTFRDPEALHRLLALAQAQRVMRHLCSNDLRRYLVLAGLRQWSGHEPGAAPAGPRATPKPHRVVRHK